jgi:hypothetical protein
LASLINFTDLKAVNMKKLAAIISFIGIAWIAGAQTDSPENRRSSIERDGARFRNDPQGKPVTYLFEIINTGSHAFEAR